MKKRNIYLVRHGQINLNKKKCYIGHMDIPLSNEGIEQAYKLQKCFATISLKNIFCSDLKRSIETAEIIANPHLLQPIRMKDLREIHMGSWEGLSFDTVKVNYPEAFRLRGEDIAHYRVPQGECFLQCQRRAVKTLENILACTEGEILIVSHAGFNRALLCKILGIPLSNLFKIGQDYGHYNILYGDTDIDKVKAINQNFK